MKLKKLQVQLILVLLALAHISFNPDKPKILIIGDSISNGYTGIVREDMKDLADVYHNPGNAKHSGYGLDSIASWIGDDKWDIIHFNWGLWDLCYRHPDSKVQGNRDKINGTITSEPEEYEKQLEAIVKILREKSDAKLIFVTTTYVPTAEAGRYTEDAIRYNEIAKGVMNANGVKINDIYELSKGIHREYGKGNDDVHYTPEGYKALAQHIVDFLKDEI